VPLDLIKSSGPVLPSESQVIVSWLNLGDPVNFGRLPDFGLSSSPKPGSRYPTCVDFVLLSMYAGGSGFGCSAKSEEYLQAVHAVYFKIF